MENKWLKNLWSSDPQTYWAASTEIQRLEAELAEVKFQRDGYYDEAKKALKERDKLSS